MDYAQARYYYAKNLGRFTSADPLYAELRRLGDPQQLNLYSYTRNNPINLRDPLGLDIEVIGEAQDEYIRRLQQNLTFKISQYSKTVKVQIVGKDGNTLYKKALKDLEKSLKKAGKSTDNSAERELFKAITDTKNHAVIDTVNESSDVFFGSFNGQGYNTVDVSDLTVLDNSSNNGGFTSAQVVGHETLGAYHSAINQTSLANMGGSHVCANQFFPGLMQVVNPNVVLTNNNGNITHIQPNFSVQDKTSNTTSTTLRIERQFVTPIPLNAIPSTGAPIPQHVVEARRIP